MISALILITVGGVIGFVVTTIILIRTGQIKFLKKESRENTADG